MAKNADMPPYGFDSDPQYSTIAKDSVEAWDMLKEVQLSLEKCEVVAPELAAWLGNAIKYANEDKREFLRRLGLAKSKGPNVIGRRICELEDQGFKREEALAKVMAESDNGEDDEKLSRSKLQRLRDDYLADKADAVQVWIDSE